MTDSQSKPTWRKAVPVLIAIVGLNAAQVTSTPEAHSRGKAYRFKGAERCFMRKINRYRFRKGLGRLQWDKQLGYVARRHARRMARNGGGIWHDGKLGKRVTRWQALGENTGHGPGCRSLFRAFRKSNGHQANILGGWQFVGVGTQRRNGNLYVQQVFESDRNPGNVYSYP